jgi:NAD(P)H-dependent flavin oxidoreductase YrpB (nitropropane dioxygenase family)
VSPAPACTCAQRIEHPIINAPTAGAADVELAAALSAAGGFGLIDGAAGAPDRPSDQVIAVLRHDLAQLEGK